jgi:hypothetical protein
MGNGGFASMLSVAPPKINSLMREWPYAPHHQKVGLIRGEVGLALTTILNPVLGREHLSGRNRLRWSMASNTASSFTGSLTSSAARSEDLRVWGKHLHTNATTSASARCCIRGKHRFTCSHFSLDYIRTVTARSERSPRSARPLTSPNEVCQCDSGTGRLRVFALNQFCRSCGPRKSK